MGLDTGIVSDLLLEEMQVDSVGVGPRSSQDSLKVLQRVMKLTSMVRRSYELEKKTTKRFISCVNALLASWFISVRYAPGLLSNMP